MKKTPLRRKTRIRPVSIKRADLNRIYRKLAGDFLAEHPFCQHWIAECGLDEATIKKNNGWYKVEPGHPLKPPYINYRGMGQVPVSTEIHHKRGRGQYYLDVSTFMACRFGHSIYIHGNTAYAYAKGYMLPR